MINTAKIFIYKCKYYLYHLFFLKSSIVMCLCISFAIILFTLTLFFVGVLLLVKNITPNFNIITDILPYINCTMYIVGICVGLFIFICMYCFLCICRDLFFKLILKKELSYEIFDLIDTTSFKMLLISTFKLIKKGWYSLYEGNNLIDFEKYVFSLEAPINKIQYPKRKV